MNNKSYMQKIRQHQDIIIEVLLYAVLGFLIGFTIKTEVSRKLTMGFEDYKIKESHQGYDFEAIKKAFNERATRGAQQGADNSVQAEPNQVSP